MPPSEVHGPLGLQLSLSIPATRSGPYSHPDDQLRAAPGRTCSQPLGESSQGPSLGRRAQSESALDDSPLLMPISRLPPAADNAAPDQSDSAPSPVPTEIIAQELTQEEIMVDIQRSGIKVRDFAYESSIPLDQRPPELFDPILAWHVYETMLENPNPARNPLNGRHLRRLLDLGWVSEQADGHRWLEQDRDALEKFDNHPHHPWKALNLTKPNKDELRNVATSRFQWVNADQLVPQFVNRGISRLAAVLRGSRTATSRHQKRAVYYDATDAEDESDKTSPRIKKRRLSTSSASAVASSSSLPASSLPVHHLPLALVNGKPPQQFPAGRPSDDRDSSPPRSTALPTQGALSRSLQRHLSMTSVASPRPPASLSRSESRTTLAQGSNRD